MNLLREIIITPFYLILIYGLALYYRGIFLRNSPLRKYFIPALSVKLVGAVSLTLVYVYYYGYGDTNSYYVGGSVIYNEFYDGNGLDSFFDIDVFRKASINQRTNIYSLIQPANYMVMRITGLLSLICFNSFLSISLLFGFLSFFGMWAMFKVFYKIEPKLKKEFAIACLFFPSVFFWGSGILKDTITLTSLGWVFYFSHKIFILKKITPKNILSIVFFSFLIISIKFYIFLSFSPVLVLWFFLELKHKIKNKLIRAIAGPTLLIIGIFVALYTINIYFEQANTSYDELVELSEYQKSALESTQSGSKYEIESFDGSIGSFLTILPQSVIISLYRPFIWEVRNPFMLLSALECSYLIFLTFIGFKNGLSSFLKAFNNYRILLPILLFTLFFAFGVGLTSGNFGTLVRYRIPIQPFFLAFLFLLNYKKKISLESIKVNNNIS